MNIYAQENASLEVVTPRTLDAPYALMAERRPTDKHFCQVVNGVGNWVLFTAETLKAAITEKRWEVETGGITLPTGVSVGTGIDDQNRITSVVANAERAGVAEVDFKAASGWARITLQELQDIAVTVALHVQACFSAERVHHEAIDALVAQHEGDAEGLQAALAAYDVELGWPETDHRNVVPEAE